MPSCACVFAGTVHPPVRRSAKVSEDKKTQCLSVFAGHRSSVATTIVIVAKHQPCTHRFTVKSETQFMLPHPSPLAQRGATSSFAAKIKIGEVERVHLMKL